MRQAKRPGLVDAVLAESLPMHGRMIHGEQKGKLYEQSQAYDIRGRVRFLTPFTVRVASLIDPSVSGQLIVQV